MTGYGPYYHGSRSGDDLLRLGNIPHVTWYTLHFFGGQLGQWLCDNLPAVWAAGKWIVVEEAGIQVGAGAGLSAWRCL